MTTNHGNQLRPFVLTSHTEDEDGLCLNLTTFTRDCCPAVAWIGTALSMDENYGVEHVYTTLVINP